jgi:3-oxoacyl-[acyl-carrier-protein] synthase II
VAERVLVTGIGSISSFGVGHSAFNKAIASGLSGIDRVTGFDTSGCHSHTAAAVRDFDPTVFIPPLKLRRIDTVGRYAIAGAHILFADAACRPGPEGCNDIGVALGTYTAGLDSLVEYLDGLTARGPIGVPAILFSNTVPNAPASLCAIEFGLRGPNVTFNQREASSLAAIAFSIGAIRRGRALAMVTGGADCLEETFFKVYDRFRALSPMPVGGVAAPTEGARPFDRARNGFILGEGAYLLLLESAAAADARGARIYGEVLGVGGTASSTPLNQWPTDARGLVNAMRLALSDAAIEPRDITAVFATANGSPALDRLEADALRKLFGDRAVPVVSIKGAIGESGAAAAAAVISGLHAVASGELPPTAGLCALDPALRVAASYQRQRALEDTFLVNSVASGGTNYSLVVRAQRDA